MSTYFQMRRAADRRSDEPGSRKRLREILGILKSHRISEGLTPEKAVAILEDLGATFVKLGQIASAHPDVLPPEYCDAFAKLRSNVSPMPAADVRARVEQELGSPVDELFSEFDDTALGSASIAQVHRAVVRDGGQVVAIKVQRPGVAQTVAQDLSLMHSLIDMYEFLRPSESGSGSLSFSDLVDELERTSADELDFHVEERNLERFAANNAGRALVSSPRCYPELTTEAVLTMDFADGVRVGRIDEVSGVTDEQRERLGYLIARNYMQQVLDDGFFHADPHAGNIIVSLPARPERQSADDAGGKGESAAARPAADGAAPGEGDPADLGIEWIDFGMMGELNSREREAIRDMALAVGRGNPYDLQRAVLRLARPKGPVDHARLLSQCDDIISSYLNVDLDGFDTGQLLNDFLGSLEGDGYEVPDSMIMLARGLVTLEGTIHLVSSRVNVMKVVTDYLAGSPRPANATVRLRNLALDGVDSVGATVELPTRALETLDMLQRGQVRVGADLKVDASFKGQLASLTTHFTYAIMAAGLFVGSCILCMTQLQPRVVGVPVLGLIGFACGLALAVYDFVDIHRERSRQRKAGR
ncbi:MAG: AarF/UbiB family protein [Coriobacteriales bacterium]|jgi:ubiquinone biosynthesis protein